MLDGAALCGPDRKAVPMSDAATAETPKQSRGPVPVGGDNHRREPACWREDERAFHPLAPGVVFLAVTGLVVHVALGNNYRPSEYRFVRKQH